MKKQKKKNNTNTNSNKKLKKPVPVKHKIKRVKRRRKKLPTLPIKEFTSLKDSYIEAFKEVEKHVGGLGNWAKKSKNIKKFLSQISRMLPTKVEGETSIPRTIHIVYKQKKTTRDTKK